ncbi:MAG: DUF1552 domain-containing protein [Pseudomonadota bacterium]
MPSLAGASTNTHTAPRPPQRLSIFYLPNGMRMDSFRPARTGTGFELPPILQPLAPLRERINVVTGLAHANAQPLGDPGGAHGRSCASFLTGAHPKPTEGSDLRCGVSMDQVAAAHLGTDTAFDSLQLGIEPSSLLGSCDIGFSCTYTNTLSWRSPTQALPVMVSPREVFERLFGDAAAVDPASRARLFDRRRSILDFVIGDAARLGGSLAASDRHKLEEYLTAVRDVEQRVQRLAGQDLRWVSEEITLPPGIPADFATHVALMIDLQVLALQTGLTRVATFMLGRELSNRAYPEIGVPDAHHSLSHHGGDPTKVAKLVKISRFHIAQLVYLLRKLQDTRDGEGTLLDSTIVLAGASLGEPNDHDCMDLPALVAGGGLPGDRHLALPRHTPMSNLMLTLLQRLGAPVDTFGDSTGTLQQLDAAEAGRGLA